MSKKKSTKKSFKSILIAKFSRKDFTIDTETIRFIFGLLFLTISFFMFLSFTSHLFVSKSDQSIFECITSAPDASVKNIGGLIGAKTAYFFINQSFGIPAYFIPIFLFFFSMQLMRAYKVRLWRWFLNCSFLMIWGSIFLACITPEAAVNKFSYSLGGLHGENISIYLESLLGFVGLITLLSVIAVLYLIYLSKRTIVVVRKILNPTQIINKNKETSNHPKEAISAVKTIENDESSVVGSISNIAVTDENIIEEKTEEVIEAENKPETIKLNNEIELDPVVSVDYTDDKEKESPKKNTEKEEKDFVLEINVAEKKEAAGKETVADNFEPFDPKKDLEYYKYPTINLLKKYDDGKPNINFEEQNENKNRIITILQNFGVEISSIKATVGPTITLYEITPAKGVRISKIRNLEDDIALSLSALGIRIIAPIPGKGTIGIEVPNKNPRIVSIESIINSKDFQECKYELPITLGKTITDEIFMVDLTKMPHLLVAGATGQGKSVGLNTIITSLLYKKHPAEMKIVLVDPKKVEFSIYSPLINHFLAKVPDEDNNNEAIITDVTKVIQTLNSLCKEMDDRYDLLKKAKCRNIKEYNIKFRSRKLSPQKGHRFMPYIVVIIDEFGDLIMTAGKEVELPIARIAQLARAIGIHMIIATQRPTTNIITGTIKANFPGRMAFKVMSQIDSRTILDRPGANQLVGKGDMLFLSGSDPIRVQCAFVDTPEIERITDYIADQQGYTMPYELPEVTLDEDGGNGSKEVDTNHLDALFKEAAQIVVMNQQGSTSLIQRKMSIGFNRAGRIMDQLESTGIVGPARGSKPREVYVLDERELESKLANIL